jgi:ribosomal protein L11 methyltransferase
MSSNRPALRSPHPAGATSWCWRRWIAHSDEDRWIESLRRRSVTSWAVTKNSGRIRSLLTAYLPTRPEAASLANDLGGTIFPIHPKQWLPSKPLPVLPIAPGFQIVHEKLPGGNEAGRLYLPHGLAFGSGEHATTFMLLRALSRRTSLSQDSILDLGTGCGVLALAARRLGARRIVATDFDAEAIRTCRQNEALNFRGKLIRWRKADVKLLRPKLRYDLVLANLFSGILCEAAHPIAASLSAGGELWMSGILHTQKEEVEAAYRKAGLELIRVVRRGQWVMLQWSAQVTGGKLKKIVQTK